MKLRLRLPLAMNINTHFLRILPQDAQALLQKKEQQQKKMYNHLVLPNTGRMNEFCCFSRWISLQALKVTVTELRSNRLSSVLLKSSVDWLTLRSYTLYIV